MSFMIRPLFVAALFFMLSAAAHADEFQTRFGQFEIGAEHNLLFAGRPLSPPVQGNSGLAILEVHQVGKTDLVLLMDTGGLACPFQFSVLTVQAAGVSVSPSFGTCAEALVVKKLPRGFYLSMTGFFGPAASARDHARARRQKHVFQFIDGVVTENGKILK